MSISAAGLLCILKLALSAVGWLAASPLNTAALIIRIGFGGPLYYNYSQEPTKIVQVMI